MAESENITIPTDGRQRTPTLPERREKSALMKILHFFRNVSTDNGRSNSNLNEQNTGKTQSERGEWMQRYRAAQIKGRPLGRSISALIFWAK